MNRRRWRKGVILLQTLVMSVVLSLMAVMVLKWVLGRYMLAARAYRTSKSFSHSEGYAASVTSSWNFGATPGNSNITMDTTQNISYTITAGPSGTNTVTFNSDEDTVSN